MASPGMLTEAFEQEFGFTELNCGAVRTARKFGCIDSSPTGTQNLSGGAFNLTFDTVAPGSDNVGFTLNAGLGEITINEADTYFVSYEYSMFELGTTTQVLLSQLQLDTGGGFAAVFGGIGAMTFQTGASTIGRTLTLQLNPGDIIRLNVSQFLGTASAATVQGGSSITIESFRDETEDAGLNIDCGDFDINESLQEINFDCGEL